MAADHADDLSRFALLGQAQHRARAGGMVGRLSYSPTAACASGNLLPIYHCNASVWGWLWGSWRW
jgi:hypothetical protein